ncbi:putative flavin-containing monooxygenase [Gordonia effusa NBRC 100432]|uniref:Putative flavin-containing monooxygenase n=1 Tax=Gordonia effusa NBRC 100432 TaxID=1077974 RepID=H0QWN2_9ACTN|nr:NAD(P)/FAD-dependent oxidoreductase [Gordonia effusa]GAB17233.1 putative flavin-containing monooxygenase [Gordonia effusa NBRC 100432]
MTSTQSNELTQPETAPSPDHHVVVIGAGLSGIASAVRLQQAGIDDFIVIDRADDLGGTWRDNTYPGVAVDIPSLAYQFTFHRNPNWSRVFAPGAEVHQYHLDVVEHFGLRPHFRFRVEVTSEQWDDEASLWRLHLADGTSITARFVISAVGPFINPKPDGSGIPGFEDFDGIVAVPARWDASYDLNGKRVAVIGTGATGVQLAGHVAPDVASMTVFQRTPVYCVPKPDFPIPRVVQLVFRLPGVGAALNAIGLAGAHIGLWFVINTPGAIIRPLMRGFDKVVRGLYRQYLRRIVDDPETADQLTPTFGIFGNRPTLNSTFPKAFNLPDVNLCTTAIERVTPKGIRTVDGTEHEFDYIIAATGHELFSEPSSYPKGRVVGVNGTDIGEWWAEHGMQAYESVAVPEFPNRWVIVGPYSWTGTGWHGLAENAVTHIVRAISLADARGATRMEVRPTALKRFTDLMLRQGRHLKFYFTELNHGIHSYWVNSAGDIPILRATTILAARRASRAFPEDDYSYR